MNMLKKALKAACYSFVGLTVFYAFLMLCIYEGDVYMSALTVFTFFPLAFFVSLANIFVKDSKKSGAIKLLVHFIIVTLSSQEKN